MLLRTIPSASGPKAGLLLHHSSWEAFSTGHRWVIIRALHTLSTHHGRRITCVEDAKEPAGQLNTICEYLLLRQLNAPVTHLIAKSDMLNASVADQETAYLTTIIQSSPPERGEIFSAICEGQCDGATTRPVSVHVLWTSCDKRGLVGHTPLWAAM